MINIYNLNNKPNKDLINIINEIDINLNILLLGCGLSNDEDVSDEAKHNLTIFSSKYKNITLSDKKIDYNFIIENNIDKNKIKKLDLIKDDINLNLANTYDYIELRWVLHFPEFEDFYIEILTSLYNKLKKDGIIGIQAFKYNYFTEDVLNHIKVKFEKIEIFKWVYENNECYTIIIGK